MASTIPRSSKACSRRSAPASADIVSAARRLDEGIDVSALGPFRLGLSKIGNRLSRFVLGRDIADPLTGFFVIRRDAFLRVAPHLRDPGFKLLLDILSSDRELRHSEVPFDFGQRLHGEFEARFLRRLAVRHVSDEQADARHRAGQPDLVPDRRRQRRVHPPCRALRRAFGDRTVRAVADGGGTGRRHQQLPAQQPPHLPRQAAARHARWSPAT